MTADQTGWDVKLDSGPTFSFENEPAAVEAWEIAEYQLGHVAIIVRPVDLYLTVGFGVDGNA